ncbi:MAG: hypothetical protein J0J04_04935 [Microbacterium sp.]|uniref:hypothetical protein n=1 Tax=Microbacterium sp. TaxID=51671 RepID=UPI001AC08448|nr:hypothetical protein [Microbacterium sp.]MBN9214153.1 hypothetical protein [Microbacterium sp.]
MSAFDETLHPRGQAANPGQFREKMNDAPAHELVPTDVTPENTRYTLLVNGVPHTVREPGAAEITVSGALDGMPMIAGTDLSLLAAGAPESTGDNWVIRAEAVGPDGNVGVWEEVPVPAAGSLLVLEHDSNYMTLSDLDGRGLTLFDVTAESDPLITPDAHYPEGPIDLDEVRKALTESPGDGPSHVELIFPPDRPDVAFIDVHVYEDFLWDDRFTAEELTEHQEIVEAVYSEWFGAELDNATDWDSTRVTLTSEIDRHRATKLLILEKAWGQYAKFRNETDPGTFGSPYVGAEIRRRIDEAKAAAEENAALVTI